MEPCPGCEAAVRGDQSALLRRPVGSFEEGGEPKRKEKSQGGHHIGYRQPQIEDCKWNTSEGLEPLGNGMNQRQMSNSTL